MELMESMLIFFFISFPGRLSELILSSLKLSGEMTHCAVFYRKKSRQAAFSNIFPGEMLCTTLMKTYLLNFIWILLSDLIK